MKRDIEHYVTRFCSCLKQRRPNVVPRAPMENTYMSAPFELVSLDFVHLEKGKGGYEYILVRVDHFTRFGQAHATTNKSAQTAANKLYNDFILQFGFPARILHDKGGEFENQLFHRLEECCGMVRSRKTLSSPKEMGKQSVLTKDFYPCCKHCQNTRSLVGRTALTKSSMPTIVRAMKQPVVQSTTKTPH